VAPTGFLRPAEYPMNSLFRFGSNAGCQFVVVARIHAGQADGRHDHDFIFEPRTCTKVGNGRCDCDWGRGIRHSRERRPAPCRSDVFSGGLEPAFRGRATGRVQTSRGQKAYAPQTWPSANPQKLAPSRVLRDRDPQRAPPRLRGPGAWLAGAPCPFGCRCAVGRNLEAQTDSPRLQLGLSMESGLVRH